LEFFPSTVGTTQEKIINNHPLEFIKATEKKGEKQ